MSRATTSRQPTQPGLGADGAKSNDVARTKILLLGMRRCVPQSVRQGCAMWDGRVCARATCCATSRYPTWYMLPHQQSPGAERLRSNKSCSTIYLLERPCTSRRLRNRPSTTSSASVLLQVVHAFLDAISLLLSAQSFRWKYGTVPEMLRWRL